MSKTDVYWYPEYTMSDKIDGLENKIHDQDLEYDALIFEVMRLEETNEKLSSALHFYEPDVLESEL